MGALVNGNFTQGDAVFNTFDNNRYFDTYLRVGADFDFIVFHLSTQFGEKLGTTVGNTALTIADTNMDGIIQAERGHAAATTPTMRRFGIWRLGADAQFYFDIPYVGGTALKGEVVFSQDTNKDFRGVAADPCRDIKGFGWILTLNQNIGDFFGLAARLDQWNPNRDVSARHLDDVHDGDDGGRQGQDHHPRHRPAAVHLGKPEAVGDLRARLARRRVRARHHGPRPGELRSPSDLLTLQLQARF